MYHIPEHDVRVCPMSDTFLTTSRSNSSFARGVSTLALYNVGNLFHDYLCISDLFVFNIGYFCNLIFSSVVFVFQTNGINTIKFTITVLIKNFLIGNRQKVIPISSTTSDWTVRC